MRKINKKKVRNIIIYTVVLIALIYIIYVIYNLIKKPTNTFLVENGSLSFEENVQGYIIRDETVIKGENYKNGISQIKTEGEKVAVGEAIFRYYTTNEQDLVNKISELDIKIQDAWDNENSIFSSDIKLIENNIEEKLSNVYKINDIQRIQELKKDINTYITKKAKIAGELSPSGSYLKNLIEQRSEYENELNNGSEYITAPKSGVVSYRVDGLEEILSTSDFGTLNKKVLEDLNLKVGQIVSTSEESGKVIDNFSCYIACVLNNKSSKEVLVGDKLKIRLSNSQEIDATVEYLSKENENENLIVFKIDKCVQELINYRKISLDIIWWNASGLKVTNSAIKYKDNGLAYVVRKRVGYTDEIYVKILKQSDKYSIIQNYKNAEELKGKGLTQDQISSRKTISLYDEITI